MNTNRISFKLITTFVLLLFAVLSIFNVTYSYFASKSSKNGELTMGELTVNFEYYYNDTNDRPHNIIVTDSTVRLYPANDTIERGVAFKIKVENEGQLFNLRSLNIVNGYDSCKTYVRFWLDAFVVNNDTTLGTTNYGKYFAFTRPNTAEGVNNFTRNNEDYCYYVEQPLENSDEISLGNELTLKDIVKEDSSVDPVPIDLSGKQLIIKLSLEAVQYGADLSEFTGWNFPNI